MEARALETTPTFRALTGVFSPGPDHWVGDGFFVRTVLDPALGAQMLSPFVLLDHAAPRHFPPSSRRRGVGEHPHRGFETVTIAYQGEVEHRDSGGGGGRIGPGDVQWMTAASGVVHEEFHSQRFSERGGDFEMVQLWVNLPAAKKMTEPRYQPLLDKQFPRLQIGAAEARLIAGELEDKRGPAETHTPMAIYDLRFDGEGSCELEVPVGWTALVCTLDGELSAGAEHEALPVGHLGVFDREGSEPIRLNGSTGARALVLTGEPLNEPVVAYGPFVMNTREQIVKAVRDYQQGKMGRLL